MGGRARAWSRMARSGPSLKVLQSLLGSLQPATQRRYLAALDLFDQSVDLRSSRYFCQSEESQDFIVLVFGENAVHDGRATFFNVAAYTTGDPVSSRLTDRSALFVSIVASLDDRSFDERASSPSYYSAAFATSERACSKLKSASIKSPCAVMLERNFGNVFLIERVYLDPKTATAPKDIAKTRAFVVKV